MEEELFVARDAWAADVLRGTELVVYGTVESLLPENGAVIKVRRVLKGNPGSFLTVRGLVAPQSGCGTRFTVGETYIYFVRSEPLTLCSKLPGSAPLLQAIQELVSAPR